MYSINFDEKKKKLKRRRAASNNGESKQKSSLKEQDSKKRKIVRKPLSITKSKIDSKIMNQAKLQVDNIVNQMRMKSAINEDFDFGNNQYQSDFSKWSDDYLAGVGALDRGMLVVDRLFQLVGAGGRLLMEKVTGQDIYHDEKILAHKNYLKTLKNILQTEKNKKKYLSVLLDRLKNNHYSNKLIHDKDIEILTTYYESCFYSYYKDLEAKYNEEKSLHLKKEQDTEKYRVKECGKWGLPKEAFFPEKLSEEVSKILNDIHEMEECLKKTLKNVVEKTLNSFLYQNKNDIYKVLVSDDFLKNHPKKEKIRNNFLHAFSKAEKNPEDFLTCLKNIYETLLMHHLKTKDIISYSEVPIDKWSNEDKKLQEKFIEACTKYINEKLLNVNRGAIAKFFCSKEDSLCKEYEKCEKICNKLRRDIQVELFLHSLRYEIEGKSEKVFSSIIDEVGLISLLWNKISKSKERNDELKEKYYNLLSGFTRYPIFEGEMPFLLARIPQRCFFGLPDDINQLSLVLILLLENRQVLSSSLEEDDLFDDDDDLELTPKEINEKFDFFRSRKSAYDWMTTSDGYYAENDIITYVDVIITAILGGYRDGCTYLLKGEERMGGTFAEHNESDRYFVVVAGAVDTVESQGAIDYHFNKEKQPAPRAGYRDDRKDMFDELDSLLEEHNNCNIKMLFPYNITQAHWLTGEVKIKKRGNHYSVILCAHDPYARVNLTKENYKVICQSIRKRIVDIHGVNSHPRFNFKLSNSPYQARQQDAVSCGVIVADDIPKRIRGESLSMNRPHPIGAIPLRISQIDTVYRLHTEQRTKDLFVQRNLKSGMSWVKPDTNGERSKNNNVVLM